MKIDQILDIILGLSRSQGFYGRLYESLMIEKESNPENWKMSVETLEGQDFKDPVDVVLYFET